MPEFLTEDRWAHDVDETTTWFTFCPRNFHNVMRPIGFSASIPPDQLSSIVEQIRWVLKARNPNNQLDVLRSAEEAEFLKLARNCTVPISIQIDHQVRWRSESGGPTSWRACTVLLFRADHGGAGAVLMSDFGRESFTKTLVLDARMGTWGWKVPGPDLKRGFGKSCLPKDTNHTMRSTSVPTPILESVVSRNESVDRVEQDWKTVGATFLFVHDSSRTRGVGWSKAVPSSIQILSSL